MPSAVLLSEMTRDAQQIVMGLVLSWFCCIIFYQQFGVKKIDV
jgi:hypothetical protein